MPQLDTSTFGYQYFGITLILFITYSLLSYIGLPRLLKFLVVRNYFIKKNKFFSFFSNLSPNSSIIFLKDLSIFVFSTKISNMLNNFFYTLATFVNMPVLPVLLNVKKGITIEFLGDTFLTYYKFLLSLEEITND